MHSFEMKMKRAAESKWARQRQMQQSAQAFTSKMYEKLEWRNQKEQEDNFKLFEKNTMKRNEWEKKNKKRQQENMLDRAYLND